jgi:hypothetical protein
VDSGDDPHVDLEELSGEVEFGFGGKAFGAIGAELSEAAGEGLRAESLVGSAVGETRVSED